MSNPDWREDEYIQHNEVSPDEGPSDPAVCYMVVTQQLVGNPESWSTDYSSDLELFAGRQAAIDHGIEVLDHDDFNIATVDAAGNLVAFGFEHHDWDDDSDNYDAVEIARQLGLPSSLAQPEACGEPPWSDLSGCSSHDDGVHRCRSASGTHRVHECACGHQRYAPEQIGTPS